MVVAASFGGSALAQAWCCLCGHRVDAELTVLALLDSTLSRRCQTWMCACVFLSTL